VLAWAVGDPGPVDGSPVRQVDRRLPVPAAGQVRVRVCRTDLHLVEGDLPPRRPGVVPGHEIVGVIVGVVEALGPGASRFQVGERVGVAWSGGTDGSCRYCRRGQENVCIAPTFTGWDVDGGYAEACVVNEAYAYRLPEGVDDEHAAPLLCAGIIGYRALRCADIPPGGRLGMYGFGERASDRPGGAGAGAAGARAHPRRAQPAAGDRARGGLGGRRHRRATPPAGRRRPLRTCR
jgi:alcohol dehydrogenase, propanol-preferring